MFRLGPFVAASSQTDHAKLARLESLAWPFQVVAAAT